MTIGQKIDKGVSMVGYGVKKGTGPIKKAVAGVSDKIINARIEREAELINQKLNPDW